MYGDVINHALDCVRPLLNVMWTLPVEMLLASFAECCATDTVHAAGLSSTQDYRSVSPSTHMFSLSTLPDTSFRIATYRTCALIALASPPFPTKLRIARLEWFCCGEDDTIGRVHLRERVLVYVLPFASTIPLSTLPQSMPAMRRNLARTNTGGYQNTAARQYLSLFFSSGLRSMLHC